MAERIKWAAFSCLHAPLTHRGYFEWLIGQLEEFRPEVVVNLGDWYEGKWAKRFSKYADETWTALQEHEAVRDQARAIRDACPGAKLVWMYGNHDDNAFNVKPDRIADDLVPSLHWKDSVAADELSHWDVKHKYGHDSYWRLGQVTFQHGSETSKAGCLRQSVYYGVPFGLHVSGHTHRPTSFQVESTGIKFPYWSANPGTGADWSRMHYIDRMDKQRWGRGLIVGDASKELVSYSRFGGMSLCWDAEICIHSVADERFPVSASAPVI